MTQTNISNQIPIKKCPILVLGTTQIYQSQTFKDLRPENSAKMLGGNGLLSALSASNQVQTALISAIGGDISQFLQEFKSNLNLNLEFLIKYPEQNSFFYLSVLDQNGVEISGKPIFNCHSDFLESQIIRSPNCKMLHCSGTDPDFYLSNLSNLKYDFLSVAVIDYFLVKKPESVIKLLNLSDIIFVNAKEFQILKNQVDFSGKILIVTAGQNGLKIYQNQQVFHFETEIIETGNTLNAGDVLAGSMLASLSLVPDLKHITRSKYAQMIDLALIQVKRLLEQHSFYRLKL